MAKNTMLDSYDTFCYGWWGYRSIIDVDRGGLGK